jgi:hypothetical protein
VHIALICIPIWYLKAKFCDNVKIVCSKSLSTARICIVIGNIEFVKGKKLERRFL